MSIRHAAFLRLRSGLALPFRLWRVLGRHKFISLVLLLLLAGGGYYGYQKLKAGSVGTRYALAAARTGQLDVSISGSGQVSVSNQLDLQPKVSGTVVSVPVTEGQTVKAGALIAQLDSRDAERAVRDASASLESSQVSLRKLKQPADALSITQAENSLTTAEQSQRNSEDDLAKAYDDGFNTVANAFLDLPAGVPPRP
ncbi:MAG: biotin/lipoyl-binding protein [Candidatus Liptonbacteria bacterium]|nr:biotin/lipoyl-binding protein [Candidatus Liptonbacteria bacterium]